MRKMILNKPGLPRRETLLAMTSRGWPGLPRRTLSVLLAMTSRGWPGLPRREKLLAMTSWVWPGLPRRTLSVLLAMTVFCGGLIACGEKSDNQAVETKPVVKIGISLPLTGAVAYVGQPAKEAALLALSKHQDTKYRYELIFEDDQLSLKKASMTGNKLFNMDKVNAAVSIWATTAPVFKDLAKQHDVIHMTCSWGAGYSDGEHNFNNTTSNIRQAQKLVEIFKRAGVKKIGYVYQVSKGDLDVKKTVFEELEKAGIKVVYAEEFNFSNRDYRIFLSKIANKQVDMLMVTMIPEDMYNFVKQKTEMGNTTPITTIDYFSTFADKKAVEGMPFVLSSLGTESFAEKFSKVSKAQLGQCIANTYDNVDLIIHAYETAPSEPGNLPTREAVAKVLRGIQNWDGALGRLDVLPNGHIDSEAFIAEVKDGKVVVEE